MIVDSYVDGYPGPFLRAGFFKALINKTELPARSRKYLNQPSLFDTVEAVPYVVLDVVRGQKLAVVGAEMAVQSADQKEKGWSKRCCQLFLWWLRKSVKPGQEFMIEQFRQHVYQYDLLEKPPSERAFGFIANRASKSGWIEFIRTDKVKNVKAHSANAAVWRKAI